MKDLPGLYWDPARNRYFSSAHRPPQTAVQTPTPTPVQFRKTEKPSVPTPSIHTRRVPLWSAPTSAARARASTAIFHARVATTESGHTEPIHWPLGTGTVCAFRTTPERQFLGDARGWLYSRARTPRAEFETSEWAPWTPELCLAPDSEISALCTTPTPTGGTRCVAVCFGPSTKICVQDADAPDRTALLSLSTVRDVRTASLAGASLVLGASRAAILLPDLDAAGPVRTLSAGSDVFTVAQYETLVYAGTRSGSALRFDTRTPTPTAGKRGAAQQVCVESNTSANPSSTSTGNAPRSSCTFLHPTESGTALVVGFSDGRLGMFDLRFARPHAPPVVAYAGHCVKPGLARLATTLDPSSRLLFAAGSDHRLRAWALGTGAPIHPSIPASAPFPSSTAAADSTDMLLSPFRARFLSPLSALQITGDDVLWAAGGDEVWRWRLGV